jgi:hypothetical protein
VAFYFNAGLALLAAAASALRGKKYVYGREEEMETISVRTPASERGLAKEVYNDPSPPPTVRIAANEDITSTYGNDSTSSFTGSVKTSASRKGTEDS